MGAEDKTQNKTEEIAGRAKSEIGQTTGNEDLQREGQSQESKANLKQAGEKVKDAFRK